MTIGGDNNYRMFEKKLDEAIKIAAQHGFDLHKLGGSTHWRLIFPDGRYIDFWPSTGKTYVPKQEKYVAPIKWRGILGFVTHAARWWGTRDMAQS